MGMCVCGFTTDPDKMCNGTHKIVKAVKDNMIAKLLEAGQVEAAQIIKNK